MQEMPNVHGCFLVLAGVAAGLYAFVYIGECIYQGMCP